MLFRKREPLPLWSIEDETEHFVMLKIARLGLTLGDLELMRQFKMQRIDANVCAALGFTLVTCEKPDKLSVLGFLAVANQKLRADAVAP